MSENILQRFLSGRKGGKAGGGGTQRVAQEAPNTLQSKAILRVVEIISEGECRGLVNGAKSIYFDDTPLQNEDGSYNFTGISFETRLGTPDQTHIAGFPAVEDEVAVAVQVKTTGAVVRTITDAATDAVRVTIRIPALTEQNTSNGDLNGSMVQVKISYQPNGGSYIVAVTPEQGTIKGKTTSPYQREYRVNLTGNPPWNLKVERITPDNNAAAIQNDTYWAAYTRILDAKLIYPDTALIGMEVDSSLFGSDIPQRSFDWYGVKFPVPSNYNPLTRAYTGIWDGTFVSAWTDNPAWVMYGLMASRRYGLGDYIDVDEIDKAALYTISQYCDELVDDGKGGHEPRFTFNYPIETQDDALRYLQLIATCFRGMLYWGAEGASGVITAVNDAPQDAIKIFSPSNVKDGLFTYSSSAAEAKHSAAYVTWNDPAAAYAAKIEVVESSAILDMTTYRSTDVVAYGCTSRGQAHRMGKWILDTELHEDELLVFSCGIADADLRPGHVIKVQDPDYADVRFSGRALSATTTTITLDAPVIFVAGQTYSIDVQMPDGSLGSKALTDGAGSHTTVHLASALATAPDPMAVWAITGSDLAPRQFRVIGVKEISTVEFEVTAMLYDPTKYARVESNVNLPTIPFTKIASGPIAPPTNMTLFEYLVTSGPLVRSAVAISWQASPDPRVVRYEIEGKKPGAGNNYELLTKTTALTYALEGTVDGTWSFRMRAFDGIGTPSPYLEITNTTLSINSTPPDDVLDLSITNLTDTSTLTWSPVTNANLSHYEIRYSTALTGATWNSAIVAIEKVAAGATSCTVPSRTGSYMIKAVTLPTANFPSGVYSANENIVVTDIDFLQNYNFEVDLTEDPTFAGTKTNTVVNAGNLELTDVAGVFDSQGTYLHHDIIDLGAVYTSRVTPSIVVAGNLSTNLVDGWPDVDAILNVDGITDGQWAIDVQVSTTNDDPTMSPVWSPYVSLDVGDIQCRALRFRTVLYSYSAYVTPSIEQLSIRIDMPDVNQGEANLLTLTGGDLHVTFPFEYRSARPAVVATPSGMSVGDYIDIDPSLITATGFYISIRNAAGARVARRFDYHAKGYGVVTP